MSFRTYSRELSPPAWAVASRRPTTRRSTSARMLFRSTLKRSRCPFDTTTEPSADMAISITRWVGEPSTTHSPYTGIRTLLEIGLFHPCHAPRAMVLLKADDVLRGCGVGVGVGRSVRPSLGSWGFRSEGA